MLSSILALTLGTSLLSLSGAFVLSLKKQWSNTLLTSLTAFSSGVLLATALVTLAPEALHEITESAVFTTIIVAIVLFFILEKFLSWHHHHTDGDECAPKPSAYLIMVGDSLHNFVDGVLIAAAFAVEPALGFMTALAVTAHEIPQEIADFSIMVAGGMKRSTALLLNAASALFSVLGAVLGYFFIHSFEDGIGYMLAFCAGMFLYISLSDLVPELHAHGKKHASWQKYTQVGLFVLGIVLMMGLSDIAGHSHDLDEHQEEDELHEVVELEGGDLDEHPESGRLDPDHID